MGIPRNPKKILSLLTGLLAFQAMALDRDIKDLLHASDSLLIYDAGRALELTKKAYDLWKDKDDSLLLSDIYLRYGNYYIHDQKLDSARFYLDKSHKINIDKMDSFRLANTVMRIGTIYDYQSKFDSATLLYYQALVIFEELNDNEGIAKACMNIGIMIDITGSASIGPAELTAVSYFDRALHHTKDRHLKAKIYNNLGVYYLSRKKWKEGLINFDLSLEQVKNDPPSRISLAGLSNIGVIHKKKGTYDSALIAYHEVLKQSKIINDSITAFNANNNIGTVLYNQRKYNDALKYYHDGLIIAQDRDNQVHLRRILKNLAVSYDSLGEHEQANKYFYQYFEIDKEINASKRTEAVAKMKGLYEAEKSANEILRLQNERDKEALAASRSRLINTIGISFLVLITLVGLIGYQRQKLKHQKNLLSERLEAGEIERTRISRELHDGVANDLTLLAKNLPENSRNEVMQVQKKTRELAHQLNARANAQFDLEDSIYDLISSVPTFEEGNVTFILEPKGLVVKDPKLKQNLYRLIQEMLANTIKHACADQIKIQLSQIKDYLSLEYLDNGIGFLPDKSYGNGILNMHDRVASLKGNIKIESAIDQGVFISVKIPYS